MAQYFNKKVNIRTNRKWHNILTRKSIFIILDSLYCNLFSLSAFVGAMARGTTKTRKSTGSGRKSKKKGPDSADVIRTKTIDEVLGIEPLVLSDCMSSEDVNMEISNYLSGTRRIEEEIGWVRR